MMKRRVAVLMAAMMCVMTIASGCGNDKDSEEATEAAAEEATEIVIDTEEPVEEEPVAEEVEEYDFGQVGPDTVSESEVTEETVVETDEYGMTAIDETKLYATEAVRIRREPNTEAEIAGKLSAGDEVTANGKSDEWHRITRNGETLYVKSEYLTETRPENTEEDAEQTAENEQTAETTDTNAAATDPTADDATAAAAVLAAANAAASASANQTATTDTTATNDTSTASSETSSTDAAAATTTTDTSSTATVNVGATYDVNGLKVNATEYRALLDTWRWATANGTDEEALEYVLHHPAGDLEAVLKSKGLR
ncbi:MAG: SH3 domain-containing protein [Lachnospiraceae bacterium]|nr:SH3 domain-containing protein [Lachnospiraceae bacterium]